MDELCHVKCNLCDADDYAILPVKSIRSSTNKKIKMVICKKCGLIYLNPRWTDARYSEFYKKEYRDLVDISTRFSQQQKLLQQMQLRGSRCVSFCHEFIGPDARILEVGCSNGGILRVFQLAGYRNLFGVEPNLAESQFARNELGLNVVSGMLGDANFEPESFDLVLLVGSIDHFQNPFNYLQSLHKLTRPEGYLFVDSYDTLQRFKKGAASGKMDHCYYFTAKTLHSLLAKTGWDTIKFERTCKFVPPFKSYDSFNKVSDMVVRFLAHKSEISVSMPNATKTIRKATFYLRFGNSRFIQLLRKVLFGLS